MGNSKSKGTNDSSPFSLKQQPATLQSVDQSSKVRQTIERLEKRKEFVGKKAANEHKMAVSKNKAGDKKGALVHLKRKKLFEKEIEKINGGVLNLEQQAMAIDSACVNVDIVSAMQTGKTALDKLSKAMDVDDIGDLKADIQEQIQTADEIDQIITQPIGMDDTDDWESELAALEAEGIEEDLNKLPSAPMKPKYQAPVDNLPSVPTHTITDDDEALAALEAEMAG